MDGYYIAEVYTGGDIEEPELRYVSAGVPDYIEQHEDRIDEALEQNQDLLMFPTTLKDAGEALEPADEDKYDTRGGI